MTAFVVADASGGVLRYGTAPEDQVNIQAQAGETVVLGVGTCDQHYVLNSVITPKAALPEPASPSVPADGVTAFTLAGLPNPTAVTISGAATDAFTVTDGTLELTFDTPGDYAVRLDAGVPYLIREFVIHAT